MNREHEENKFHESTVRLDHSLKYADQAEDNPIYLSAIIKDFEVCVEYAWKHLQKKVIEAGLEPKSPRETIKLAGRIELIDDVEKWIHFLDDRNRSVHDYLGVTTDQYMRTIQDFHREVKKLMQRKEK